MNVFYLLLYSLIILMVYYLFPVKFRPSFLLMASMAFYYLIDAKFLILLLLEILISYFIAKQIKKCQSTKDKKLLLWLGVLIVLVTLAYFKYQDFFILGLQNFNDCFGLPTSSNIERLLMPIGISYYSFKIISYLVDTYRDNTVDCSLLEYALYVSFFPQIICGPIARADNLIRQLNYLIYRESLFVSGISNIIVGVFKKIVIADRMAPYVNKIFTSFMSYPSLASILAVILYSIQLYCDFSGYSSIAIGIGQLFGIDSFKNFDFPYFSTSIKEFWARWHISLSSWLKDYVYIPLGGNRNGKLRTKINIIITFLISGIWHGSTLNFVIWGLIHGIWNALSRVKRSVGSFNIKSILAMIVTYFGVTISWIFFRMESFSKACDMIIHMIKDFTISYSAIINTLLPFTGDNSSVSYLLVLFVLVLFLLIYEWRQFNGKGNSLLWIDVMLLCILFFGSVGSNFLYGQF